MGNYWVCFWLISFWGTKEVLGLVGKEGSKHKCSELPQGGNIVNRNLFLPALIVGSFTKAPHGRGPVCSLILPY